MNLEEDTLWSVRAFVYQHVGEMTHPPHLEETAARFGLSREQAAAAYEELNHRHAFFLRPGTHDILMANPFSAVETPFQVYANGKTYFANCAWDSLGIPAALQMDADIKSECAQSEEPIQLHIVDHQISESNVLVHFLIPFREWYSDLSFT